jgi:arginyl-tRNA synthetase
LQSILDELSRRVAQAIAAIGAEGEPQVRASQDDRFGDYQSNCPMGLAKAMGKKPRDVAEAIIEKLVIEDLCESPEIAGPGFINFRLKPAYLAKSLTAVPPADTIADRLGIARHANPRTVVVDLSSPNLAKEMHVGHLRSTVIGDCVARILEFAGHDVHRENHVGDWGTQFGMLVAFLQAVHPEVVENPDTLEIKDLESFYVEAKARFDADEDFRTIARETVVKLQQGDPVTRRIWQAFCAESLRHCHEIYERLGVRLIDRGESFYTVLMDEVSRRLEKLRKDEHGALVRVSEGALCVFVHGFKTRDGEALPMIVRKTDGGYNYAASDLATILHRVESLHATRIVYVVGLPQKQHFEMLFAAVRALGWVRDDVSLEHLGFGSMLGADARPFKTREGGTVKLKNLLDEAVARARLVVEKGAEADDPRSRDLTKPQIEEIAERIGIASVKYFDLSHALNTDYRFDWETMLSLEGNTAPYMMYAYARIRSIGRKAGVDFAKLPADAPILLDNPVEAALARQILRFAETLAGVEKDLRPNLLTDYLFQLAKAFSRFYDKKLGVRVIDASPESVRMSRLRLCDLTARTLRIGLGLLGIETVEQM